MVDNIFPFLKYFKKLILRIYWPSDQRIKEIKIPILIITGTEDEIVPTNNAQKL